MRTVAYDTAIACGLQQLALHSILNIRYIPYYLDFVSSCFYALFSRPVFGNLRRAPHVKQTRGRCAVGVGDLPADEFDRTAIESCLVQNSGRLRCAVQGQARKSFG